MGFMHVLKISDIELAADRACNKSVYKKGYSYSTQLRYH